MPLVKTLHSISTTFRPNRASNSNPSLRDPLPSAHHFFDHHWSGTRANSIYLDLLAIDTRYRGEGHAKALVHWGLDRAREEGVCASVVSSGALYPFFLKMGFVHEVGTVTEGKGNPLKDTVGGWILFTPTPDGRATAEAGDAAAKEDIELFSAALKSAKTRSSTPSSTE